MSPTLPSDPAAAAALLDDQSLHVWHLGYRRAQGRSPLRRLLAAYLDTEPDDVRLVEDAHGRPRLQDAPARGLDFNWSHSGEHALVAIARGVVPGVDIERRRPRRQALALARRFFDGAEVDALEALPQAARDDAFLELWTAKEALLKAHGRGIAYGLQRVLVAASPARLKLLRFDGEDVDAWQLQRLALAPDLIAAVAWRGAARKIRSVSLPTLAEAG